MARSKKQAEISYLEEARRASSIFPHGELVPQEKPDFLLRAESGTIGIEITELCREKPRAEAASLSKVPDKAKTIYNRKVHAQTMDVSAVFSVQAESIKFNDLTTSLAEFVYRNRSSHRSVFTHPRDLPNGYYHIYIGNKLRNPMGRWHATRAFGVAQAAKELLQSCIAKKNLRLLEYRLSAPEVWLLVINDPFLGPGAVYTRPEDLAKWKFDFKFEKVLLFLREPIRGSQVIELQRA